MKARLVEESYHFERNSPMKDMGIGKYCLIQFIRRSSESFPRKSEWEIYPDHIEGVSYAEAKEALKREESNFASLSASYHQVMIGTIDVYFRIVPYNTVKEFEDIHDIDKFAKKAGITLENNNKDES